MEMRPPFTLVTPKRILREIEEYAQAAIIAKQFGDFKRTLQVMVEGLELDPTAFGDLQTHLKKMKVDQYIAAHGPWAFTYGVHAERKLVFIRFVNYSQSAD